MVTCVPRNRTARFAVLGSSVQRPAASGYSSTRSSAVRRKIVVGCLVLLSLVLITVSFRSDALDPVQALGGREVRRQDRKRAPHRGEPEVRMERAAEELEVVGHDDERSDGDEDERATRSCRPRPHRPIAQAAAIETAASATSTPARDPRAKRPPVQLVECVRADAHGEKERERRPPEQRPTSAAARAPRRSRHRRGARACTAGGAASRSRASRRARARRTRAARRRSRAAPPHDDPAAEAEPSRPHVARGRRRARGRAPPRAGSARRSRGCSAPRKRPTSRHAGETSAPAPGRPIRT